ncbi:LTA synthase family protein [Hydrogenophaga sp.]|uniref:LTA synthase family protein n=1 Tax=Hydrogenophaga sp. TaxID=1904254 RepID=UPI0026161339|nr:LTA synthase family protein [Hydrogenophaga sp.]MCW5654068.1 LTA synthase family protein [Hydrogenophaga sp.]
MRLALALVMPMLSLVMAIKTYKLGFALWPVTGNTDGWTRPSLGHWLAGVLTQSFSVVLAAALLTYLALRLRPTLSRGARALAIVLLPLVLLAVLQTGRALWSGNPLLLESPIGLAWLARVYGELGHEIWYLYTLFRADLAYAGAHLLLCMAILGALPERWTRTAFAALVGLNLLIALVLALELAHYLVTGVNGSAALLLYFIANAEDVWDLAGTEVRLPDLLWWLAPLPALLLASYLLASTPLKPRGGAATARFQMGRLLWPGLALLAMPEMLSTDGHQRLKGNVVSRMTIDLAVPDMLSQAARDAGLDLARQSMGLRLEGSAQTRKFNVVVVMLESVRARSTGLHDPALSNTPFLLALSQQSLMVEEMYAPSSRTSVAWISALQGIYAGATNSVAYWAQREAGHPRFASLPRLLREHGYRSAFFSTTHDEYENEAQILANFGFDKVVGERDFKRPVSERVNYFGLEDRVMLDPLMAWVDEQRGSNTPFFLKVMTNVGHHAYATPAHWPNRTFREGVTPDHHKYLNCIAYIDSFLQDLVSQLDQRGLRENTVLMVLGDHGDTFGEHGQRARVISVHDEVLHVPMLIRLPTSLGKAPGRVAGPRSQVDILPTVADLLGLTMVGGRLPGVSLLTEHDPQRRVFHNGTLEESSMAMRQGSLKYVYEHENDRLKVFDIRNDLFEQRDIAASLSREQRNEALRQMHAWYTTVHASMTLSAR